MFRLHPTRCFMARQANGRVRAVWVRWLLACCALQVFMAMLGQMHQVAHAPRAGAALAAWKNDAGAPSQPMPGTAQAAADGSMAAADKKVAGSPVADTPVAESPATSGIERWFGAHGSADCELFHHLAMGPAMAGAATALHTFLFAPVRNACMGAVLLRQSPALFFARGPPMALFHF